MAQIINQTANLNEATQVCVPHDERRVDDLVQVKVLKILIQDLEAKNIADVFGIESALFKRLKRHGRSIRTIDPMLPNDEELFDLAVASNILSRISENKTEQILDAIARVSSNAAFIISLTFADHVLSDGRNAHKTIQSQDWWLAQIRRHFTHAEAVSFPGSNEICITTWRPSARSLTKLKLVRQTQTLKKVVSELVSRPFRYALRTIQPGFLDASGLAEHARGKSIAIVGNSPKLAQASHGAEIDGHDIVLRLKRCPIIDIDSYGERTDWFATAVDFDMNLFRNRDPSLFLWLSFRKHPPLKILNLGCPVYCAGRKDQKRGADKLDAPPSIGFTAVDLILSLPARAVTIYGFDGMKTASLSSQFTRQSTVIHDHTDEMDVIEQMAREHGRTRIVPLS